MRIRLTLGVLLATGLAALAPAPASCLILTITFDGTVTEIDAPLSSAFASGGTAFGSFQIDAATSDMTRTRATAAIRA
jgi:hypothetical protein